MSVKVTFPELRGLMAKYGLTQKDVGEIAGCTEKTIGNKLCNRNNFTLSEMLAIKKHFKKLGSDLSVDDIFFAWILTKVSG